MKAATKKIRRELMALSPKEKALRMVCEDARQAGKRFKNPNNIIYRGPSYPWYKSRLKHADTGQIAPFNGTGLSQKEAKTDLLKQMKRAGWAEKMSEHRVTVDEKTGKKKSVTRSLYKVEFAPNDTVLPTRLAKKYGEYGTPWHSARRWKLQDRISKKRRIRTRNWEKLKKRLVTK